jgi:folate-binding protein YgfZ
MTHDYKVLYSHKNLDMPMIWQYQDPRFSKLGVRSIVDHNGAKAPRDDGVENRHHEERSDVAIYTQDKYLYSIPEGALDLIYDKSMPQEYGLDTLSAISYTKGCYVGQEVISRTKYQGVVRKQIFQICADADLGSLPPSCGIFAGEHKIGIFCSGYHNYGLGLIRLNDYAMHNQMELTLDGISITLKRPEWLKS